MNDFLKKNTHPPDIPFFPNIIGKSPAMLKVFKLIHKAAESDATVLVLGETGTGKELVAKAIHEEGQRRGKPFVAINCGAIPETLLESELFGHKRGAFTGAISDKIGLIEAANGGTLFMDEISELKPYLQAKLLRALNEKTIRPVGGNEEIKVDFRIISATNRDLKEEIRKGNFREDLYWRIEVIEIMMPTLKERGDDKLLLANFFLENFRNKSEYQGHTLPDGFTEDAIALLKNYDYPGNVRELENAIQRALTLSNDKLITPDSLPPAFHARESFIDYKSENPQENISFENLLSSLKQDNWKSEFPRFENILTSLNDADKRNLLEKISSFIDWYSFFEDLRKNPKLDPSGIASRYSVDYITFRVEPILCGIKIERKNRGMLRSLSRMFSEKLINITDFNYFPLDISSNWGKACKTELESERIKNLRAEWEILKQNKTKAPSSDSLIDLPATEPHNTYASLKSFAQKHRFVLILFTLFFIILLLFCYLYNRLQTIMAARDTVCQGYNLSNWHSCLINGYPQFSEDKIGIIVRGDQEGGFKNEILYNMINKQIIALKGRNDPLSSKLIDDLNNIVFTGIILNKPNPNYYKILQNSKAYLILPDLYNVETKTFDNSKMIFNFSTFPANGRKYTLKMAPWPTYPPFRENNIVGDYTPPGTSFPYISFITQNMSSSDIKVFYSQVFRDSRDKIVDEILGPKRAKITSLSDSFMEFLEKSDPDAIWPTVYVPKAFLPQNYIERDLNNVKIEDISSIIVCSISLMRYYNGIYHGTSPDDLEHYKELFQGCKMSEQLSNILSLEMNIERDSSVLSYLDEYANDKFYEESFNIYYLNPDLKMTDGDIGKLPKVYGDLNDNNHSKWFNENDLEYIHTVVSILPSRLSYNEFRIFMTRNITGDKRLQDIMKRFRIGIGNIACEQLLPAHYSIIDNPDYQPFYKFIAFNMLSQIYFSQRLIPQYIDVTNRCYHLLEQESLKPGSGIETEDAQLYLRSTAHALSIISESMFYGDMIRGEMAKRYAELWKMSESSPELKPILAFDLWFEAGNIFEIISKDSGQTITWETMNAILSNSKNNIVRFILATSGLGDDNKNLTILKEIYEKRRNGIIPYGEPLSRLDYYYITIPSSWVSESIKAKNCNSRFQKNAVLPILYGSPGVYTIGCRPQQGKTSTNNSNSQKK